MNLVISVTNVDFKNWIWYAERRGKKEKGDEEEDDDEREEEKIEENSRGK